MNNSFNKIKMNGLKIISTFVILFSLGLVSKAQNLKMETYKFGEGINFSNDNGAAMKMTGFVQPFMENKTYTGLSEDNSENRFRMRRIRIRLDGNPKNERFSYRLAFDLSGTSEAGDDATSAFLLDANISYKLTSRIKATFGQRSTFTDNRELFMSSNTLQLPERSRVTSAFSTIREFGLFLQGNFKTGRGTYLKPYFTLTNGDGGNAIGRDRGGLKVGGRIDFLPFGLFTNKGQFRQADVMRELTPKFVIGANFSQNYGMSSRRGRESGAIVYLDVNNEESLPNFTKYGVDFLFKYKGFSMLGEFVKTEASVPDDISQRVRNDGTIATTFLVDGTQDVQSYVKGRMMLGEAFNIQMGYLFKNGISIDGRFTHLIADEFSFLNNATFYNRPNYYTLGISKYLSRGYGAKIQGSFTYIDGSDGINNNAGVSITGNEILTRIILTISI